MDIIPQDCKQLILEDAKKDILTIPKPVRVLRNGHTMLGSGLVYLVSKGQLNLKNPVLLRHAKVAENED